MVQHCADGMSPDQEKPTSIRRTVCDHCRRRRIRCDGGFPCQQCYNASLTCKRDHIPRKRGPKRGTGRVINELRAQERTEPLNVSEQDVKREDDLISPTHSQSPDTRAIAQWVDSVDLPSSSSTSRAPSHHNKDPPEIFDVAPQPDFSSLIPTCVELFFEHLSPIMPVIHVPTLRAIIQRPLSLPEKNLVYALCAVTSTHMSGKSIPTPPLPMLSPSISWEYIGRFFLNECLTVRKSYDFVEDLQLSSVISSYFVSTACFELNMNRKSWYYLREALTLAQDLGLQDEDTYADLDHVEALCRRRTFWLLYVTERSFAIFRHKPLTFSKTPLLPGATDLHPYESATIHSGFMHLVQIYSLLDDSFVNSWNETKKTGDSALTYSNLQAALNNLNILHQFGEPGSNRAPLNDIQKADILVTQQWLRLIIWQSSMRQGLLSFSSADPSMTFRYPLHIAHSLLQAISLLPATSIEVHGMGIFEKIFEVGCSMVDVVQASGLGIESLAASHPWRSPRDPFSSFIQILSGNPNSQKMYANLLMAKAAEKPEIQRFGLLIQPPMSGSVLEEQFYENGRTANSSVSVGGGEASVMPKPSANVPTPTPTPTRVSDQSADQGMRREPAYRLATSSTEGSATGSRLGSAAVSVAGVGDDDEQLDLNMAVPESLSGQWYEPHGWESMSGLGSASGSASGSVTGHAGSTYGGHNHGYGYAHRPGPGHGLGHIPTTGVE